MPCTYFTDPILAPKNFRDLKGYALAKENGIKAAQYFMKSYPELFYRDQAEPKVEKLSYPDVFTKEMEFSLDDIRVEIEKRNVSNAIIAFEKLSEQQAEIPIELKLSLFQLVCFFNSKDPFEFVEELPFSRKASLTPFEPIENYWNQAGFAAKMWSNCFEKANNKDANSTFIKGLVKYGACDKAYTTYKEFEKNDKLIHLDAFNSLIRALPFVNAVRQDLDVIEQFLNLININNFKPTIETINSLLSAIAFMNHQNKKRAIELAEKLLLDCKTIGLKQNLGTYYYVLSIFYTDKNDDNQDLIYKIIDKVEANRNSIKLECKEDCKFCVR